MTYPLTTNFTTTFTATDLNNVDTLVNTEWTLLATVGGLTAARVGTITETLTIAAGTVTTITGTTVDSVTVAVNDRIFIPNAPASTGAAGGSTFSSQPANGLYYVTAVASNISVSRLPIMSATGPASSPAGMIVPVIAGTYATLSYMVTTPASYPTTFTYGTTAMAFTQAAITPTGTQTFTNKRITKRVGSTTSSATPTFSTDSYDLYKLTAQAADITSWSVTGTSTDGQEFWLRIKDDGTARNILWSSPFAGDLPTKTTAGKTITLKFVYDTVDSLYHLLAVDTRGY